MSRIVLSFSSAVALALAGCTTYYDPPSASTMRTTDGAPVVSASASPVAAASSTPARAHRAGFGIIESIALATPAASASAGGTAPAVSGPYRVTLRMEDGSMQTMTVDNRAFLVGDRVQVLPDGKLVRA